MFALRVRAFIQAHLLCARPPMAAPPHPPVVAPRSPPVGGAGTSSGPASRRPAGGVHQPHLRVLAGHAAPGPGRRRVRPAHRHQHLLGRPAQRAGAQPGGGSAAALCGRAAFLHPHQEAAGTGGFQGAAPPSPGRIVSRARPRAPGPHQGARSRPRAGTRGLMRGPAAPHAPRRLSWFGLVSAGRPPPTSLLSPPTSLLSPPTSLLSPPTSLATLGPAAFPANADEARKPAHAQLRALRAGLRPAAAGQEAAAFAVRDLGRPRMRGCPPRPPTLQ